MAKSLETHLRAATEAVRQSLLGAPGNHPEMVAALAIASAINEQTEALKAQTEVLTDISNAMPG